MDNGRTRKKDSARLVWDSKPRRAPNPKDIESQTAAYSARYQAKGLLEEAKRKVEEMIEKGGNS